MGTHPIFESDFDCLTEKMKLYSHQVSPYTRLVEITALVSKQKLEIQNVALFTGEQNEDWFLKINPKHQVPVLELADGSHLTESDVIAKYLVKLAGGNWLYPSDPFTQAKI